MVTPGIDLFCKNELGRLKAKRLGLLVHPASCTSNLQHLAHLLLCDKKIEIGAIFGPEHGYRGTAQDMEGVVDSGGEKKGPAIYSLYGNTKQSLRPPAGSLKGLDALVVDLQDVGARYYTFVYTMAFCMEACREEGVEVIVLDRPNPIDGKHLEGPLLKSGMESFVGMYPIPVRHGMTICELAGLFNDHFKIGCQLTQIPMDGWKREMNYEDTGLPWILPSPNMPTTDTALVYPGMCLVEGTNLSEGRGTTRPFELVGAPWIDPDIFTGRLNGLSLPGVKFRPCFFKPTFQKHAGKDCGGVQLHVTDRNSYRSFETGLAIIAEARAQNPQMFQWRTDAYEFETKIPAFDLLTGDPQVRTQLEAGATWQELAENWQTEIEEFEEIRKPYLLYR